MRPVLGDATACVSAKETLYSQHYLAIHVNQPEIFALPQVAGLIASLQLDRNCATLVLSNLLDEEEGDDDALTRPATKARCVCLR